MGAAWDDPHAAPGEIRCRAFAGNRLTNRAVAQNKRSCTTSTAHRRNPCWCRLAVHMPSTHGKCGEQVAAHMRPDRTVADGPEGPSKAAKSTAGLEPAVAVAPAADECEAFCGKRSTHRADVHMLLLTPASL